MSFINVYWRQSMGSNSTSALFALTCSSLAISSSSLQISSKVPLHTLYHSRPNLQQSRTIRYVAGRRASRTRTAEKEIVETENNAITSSTLANSRVETTEQNRNERGSRSSTETTRSLLSSPVSNTNNVTATPTYQHLHSIRNAELPDPQTPLMSDNIDNDEDMIVDIKLDDDDVETHPPPRRRSSSSSFLSSSFSSTTMVDHHASMTSSNAQSSSFIVGGVYNSSAKIADNNAKSKMRLTALRKKFDALPSRSLLIEGEEAADDAVRKALSAASVHQQPDAIYTSTPTLQASLSPDEIERVIAIAEGDVKFALGIREATLQRRQREINDSQRVQKGRLEALQFVVQEETKRIEEAARKLLQAESHQDQTLSIESHNTKNSYTTTQQQLLQHTNESRGTPSKSPSSSTTTTPTTSSDAAAASLHSSSMQSHASSFNPSIDAIVLLQQAATAYELLQAGKTVRGFEVGKPNALSSFSSPLPSTVPSLQARLVVVQTSYALAAAADQYIGPGDGGVLASVAESLGVDMGALRRKQANASEKARQRAAVIDKQRTASFLDQLAEMDDAMETTSSTGKNAIAEMNDENEEAMWLSDSDLEADSRSKNNNFTAARGRGGGDGGDHYTNLDEKDNFDDDGSIDDLLTDTDPLFRGLALPDYIMKQHGKRASQTDADNNYNNTLDLLDESKFPDVVKQRQAALRKLRARSELAHAERLLLRAVGAAVAEQQQQQQLGSSKSYISASSSSNDMVMTKIRSIDSMGEHTQNDKNTLLSAESAISSQIPTTTTPTATITHTDSTLPPSVSLSSSSKNSSSLFTGNKKLDSPAMSFLRDEARSLATSLGFPSRDVHGRALLPREDALQAIMEFRKKMKGFQKGDGRNNNGNQKGSAIDAHAAARKTFAESLMGAKDEAEMVKMLLADVEAEDQARGEEDALLLPSTSSSRGSTGGSLLDRLGNTNNNNATNDDASQLITTSVAATLQQQGLGNKNNANTSNMLGKVGSSTNNNNAPVVVPTRLSLIPEGFKNWSEVAAVHATNVKRNRKSDAALTKQNQQVLDAVIKTPRPPGEARVLTPRQVRVSSNLSSCLAEALSSHRLFTAEQEPGLYPGGLPLEIVEVEVTPDLRTAYIRWRLPLPPTEKETNTKKLLQVDSNESSSTSSSHSTGTSSIHNNEAAPAYLSLLHRAGSRISRITTPASLLHSRQRVTPQQRKGDDDDDAPPINTQSSSSSSSNHSNHDTNSKSIKIEGGKSFSFSSSSSSFTKYNMDSINTASARVLLERNLLLKQEARGESILRAHRKPKRQDKYTQNRTDEDISSSLLMNGAGKEQGQLLYAAYANRWMLEGEKALHRIAAPLKRYVASKLELRFTPRFEFHYYLAPNPLLLEEAGTDSPSSSSPPSLTDENVIHTSSTKVPVSIAQEQKKFRFDEKGESEIGRAKRAFEAATNRGRPQHDMGR